MASGSRASFLEDGERFARELFEGRDGEGSPPGVEFGVERFARIGMNRGVVLLRGGLSAFVFDASDGGFGAFAESFGFGDFVDLLLERGAFGVVDGGSESFLERLERGGSESSTIRPVGELERFVHVLHAR